MSTNPATLPAAQARDTTTPPVAAPTTARRLTRRERALRHWNRMALLFLGVILFYMASSLFLIPAPVDQPELPAIFAGFGVAPLFGLAVAYWLIRMDLKQR